MARTQRRTQPISIFALRKIENLCARHRPVVCARKINTQIAWSVGDNRCLGDTQPKISHLVDSPHYTIPPQTPEPLQKKSNEWKKQKKQRTRTRTRTLFILGPFAVHQIHSKNVVTAIIHVNECRGFPVCLIRLCIIFDISSSTFQVICTRGQSSNGLSISCFLSRNFILPFFPLSVFVLLSHAVHNNLNENAIMSAKYTHSIQFFHTYFEMNSLTYVKRTIFSLWPNKMLIQAMVACMSRINHSLSTRMW